MRTTTESSEISRKSVSDASGTDVRCDCGSLLARRKGDRIELKCRRCRRVVGIAVVVTAGGGCSCKGC